MSKTGVNRFLLFLALSFAVGGVSVAENDHTSPGSQPEGQPTPLPEKTQKPKASFSGKIIPIPEKLPFTLDTNQEAFYSLYRRPNDDTFQNGGDATKAGTPFQVGWMWCSLVETRNPDGSLKAMDFRWDYENLTGRHAEAPSYFVLRESRSSLAGEEKPVRFPERPRDKAEHGMSRVSVAYPDGVKLESPTNLKRGTKSAAKLTVITGKDTPLADGEYSGNLELRIDPRNYSGPTGGGGQSGLEQVEGTGGPREGIYKEINWTVKVKDGKVVSRDVNCRRFNENQPLQLADNNIGKESPYKDKGYTEQTAAAECNSKKENVGQGDLPAEESDQRKADLLNEAMGKVFVEAGCLSCHGDGTGDNFRFCDDGRPLRPGEDAFKLYSMILNGVPHRATPPQYPRGMIRGVIKIRNQLLEDKTGGGLRATLREWVESQKTEAKVVAPNEEIALMEKAQAADEARLKPSK